MKLWRALALIGLLQGCNSDKQYILDAQITPEARNLRVKGQANLPDQAYILVSWLDPRETRSYSRHVVVQEFGPVKQGHFEVLLKPLRPVPPGSYQVRLNVTPAGYDWSGGVVSAEVGAKGENLHGKYVVQSDGVQQLVNLIPVEYKGK